jgi:prepilin signal peptidase PulO-like enzyme (type II secretory pathway)
MLLMTILILIVLGLCLGSFINALVWRLHEQEKLRQKKTLKKVDKDRYAKLSILKGRSMCPDCKHELLAKDLVPVFSWLSLRGKCRYCQKSISMQYPIVEITTAVLFVLSYVLWPVKVHGLQVAIFILWLPLLIGLIALAIYDLKWLILPNRIIYPLTYLALIMAIIDLLSGPGFFKELLNEVLAVAIGGGIFYVLFQFSNGKWIGGGDVRLGGLLGLVMNTPGKSILLLFIASATGTLISLPLLMSSRLKRNSVIPFGPFLILAAIVVQLVGHFILSWYQNAFFPSGV